MTPSPRPRTWGPCHRPYTFRQAEGIVAVPRDKLREVLAVAEEIDAREAKQSKFILAEKSINKGIAAYGRI